VETLDVPFVIPMLRTDLHAAVSVGAAVEVQAIGHMLDHRWTTCPTEFQPQCRSRFVIDRLLPADALLDDAQLRPWAIPADFPKDQPSEPIDVLRSIVGGVSVVSIGNADANGVRSIEPLVDEVNNEQGAWVIRALVGGDATPTVRTFLVGHIGWWTVFEVSEAAVIDRTPPLEGAPTPVPSDEPARTFPPAGSIVVFLPKDGGFEPSKIRAALVDLSGRVTGVRAPRPNEPRLIANAGGGRGALLPDPAVPDRYQLVWSGGICDKDMIVTIDATFSKVVVDSPLPGDCDSIAQEHRLVLDIDGAVSPPAVEVRYAETSAGAS
jgi:hypothetical protein